MYGQVDRIGLAKESYLYNIRKGSFESPTELENIPGSRRSRNFLEFLINLSALVLQFVQDLR